MLQALVVSTLVAASGWVVPAPPCFAHGSAAAVARHPQFCMQEDAAEGAAAVAAVAADQVNDFTEDLLDALSTDEVGFEEQPATFYKAADGVELTAMPSFTNMQSVEAMRSRYALHENDTGSSQVQIAVLTARIAYMTKHMETNKKDYSSLRGLTAMVTRRRKLLEYLLREDLGEFKRLTSELGIRTNQLLKPKLQGARGRRV
uniref:30S ribosomal protein S15 n=2 Tax=Haptolina brevifila TaxID=156173 RepID=A0A7S2FLC6_9EUKA|mmetsp:Transcript_14911/g.29987  ORF Transcript_14911/g.29987 Transcript_14911/m.29987 type:complete len:203 (+) Transcript_14911:132-740(+)